MVDEAGKERLGGMGTRVDCASALFLVLRIPREGGEVA